MLAAQSSLLFTQSMAVDKQISPGTTLRRRVIGTNYRLKVNSSIPSISTNRVYFPEKRMLSVGNVLNWKTVQSKQERAGNLWGK